VRESQRKILEAEQIRKSLESKLQLLDSERVELSRQLDSEKKTAEQLAMLRSELEAKESEIAKLSKQLEDENEEQERLQQEVVTYQENLNAMMSEFWSRRNGPATNAANSNLSDRRLSVVSRYFIPPPSNVPTEEKFQKNVFSDHHRVGHTRSLLAKLAKIDFIRELGLDYRHNIKSGKVQIKERVEELELLVPYKGEADIIRIVTTAQTKAQQLFAAHLIGEDFEVEVQC